MRDAHLMTLAAERIGAAADLMARAARVNARLIGMVAANTERESNGLAFAYDEAAFDRLIGEEHIGANDVTAALNA